MRTLSLLAIALVGCGGATPSPRVRGSAAQPTEPDAPRLGCLVVERGELEGAALDRTAAFFDVRATEAEIDHALEAVLATHLISERQLDETLDASGMSREAYRRELGRQLVERRLMLLTAPDDFYPPAEELERAYAERYGQDRGESELSRRFLMGRIREEHWEEHGEAITARWRTRLVAWWRAVPTATIDGRCVERLPTARPAEIVFEGNENMPSQTLHEYLASLRRIPIGPLNRASEEVSNRVAALYYERGHLQVSLGTMEPSGDGWILPIEEGPVYRLRRVRVVEQQGEERVRLVDAERWVSIEPGPFVRSRIQSAMSQMEALLEEQGGADVSLEPETEVDEEERAVDLTLVVRRAS